MQPIAYPTDPFGQAAFARPKRVKKVVVNIHRSYSNQEATSQLLAMLFGAGQIALHPQGGLFLHPDGLSELRNAMGSPYPLADGLHAFVRPSRSTTSAREKMHAMILCKPLDTGALLHPNVFLLPALDHTPLVPAQEAQALWRQLEDTPIVLDRNAGMPPSFITPHWALQIAPTYNISPANRLFWDRFAADIWDGICATLPHPTETHVALDACVSILGTGQVSWSAWDLRVQRAQTSREKLATAPWARELWAYILSVLRTHHPHTTPLQSVGSFSTTRMGTRALFPSQPVFHSHHAALQHRARWARITADPDAAVAALFA